MKFTAAAQRRAKMKPDNGADRALLFDDFVVASLGGEQKLCLNDRSEQRTTLNASNEN